MVLALIALLIWLLMGLLKGNDSAANTGTTASSTSDAATPQSSGADGSVIQANVSPTNWKVGDCIKGYVDINTRADVVSCSTGHSGQLIGTFSYGSGDSFPGEEALRNKGDDYCAGIELTASASNYDIRQQFGYPTESTWNKGDRRIDCIAYTKGGEIIKENLIKSPHGHGRKGPRTTWCGALSGTWGVVQQALLKHPGNGSVRLSGR